jgi:alkanesulfonate monooxygenase SsuD/methylene tetrahydromethanopterin reductase-like flavin-dependent oxidoreductase (luciferase family)
MRYGLDVSVAGAFADPRLIADLAAEAEDAGWDGFFVWDGVFGGEPGGPAEPLLNPWVTLAAVAVATSRIRIGAMVTPLARRRPWQVSSEAVTLDHLSDGRVTLGAGLGHRVEEFADLGEDPDPRTRALKLDESLAVLDALWRGEPVDFDGEVYRLRGVRLLPRPVQRPRIPIWTAAGWPRRRPLRRAACWDGVYLMTFNQRTGEFVTPDEVTAVAYLCRRYRDSQEPFDIAVNGVPADDADLPAYVRELERAGATWWVGLSPETPELYRERIRRGPPR